MQLITIGKRHRLTDVFGNKSDKYYQVSKAGVSGINTWHHLTDIPSYLIECDIVILRFGVGWKTVDLSLFSCFGCYI